MQMQCMLIHRFVGKSHISSSIPTIAIRSYPGAVLEKLLSGFQNNCNYQGLVKGAAYCISTSSLKTHCHRSYRVTLSFKVMHANHEITQSITMYKATLLVKC